MLEHLVARYANISIMDVGNLPYDDYLLLRRNAFIHRLSQTEEGIEYLNKCYYIEQTEPDRRGLREHFGKKGG